MINWSAFSIKNPNQEEAFEQMAYLLFCAEFDNHIGLFRYKNQTGIETEPLEKDGILYGFSAKFYEVKLNERKSEIIENITKAKRKNPDLKVLYFYTNQELSESSKIHIKKPKYQIEIEQKCNNLGLQLQWRVPSHLEIQLSNSKNKYIYDLFFNLNPTLDKLYDNAINHNSTILKAIRTSIPFNENIIEINRNTYIQNIFDNIINNRHIIISGEGGSGKTAIIKQFYEQYSTEMPICIFRASELNVNHIGDLFKFDHNFSIGDFFDVYKSEKHKVFIIDSAEKLPEIANQNIFNDLIDKLKENNWIIVFTTRLVYLDDLRFHLKENYSLNFQLLNIEQISSEELNNLASKYNFSLPINENFKDRIRNLFYLNEYLKYISNSENLESFSEFIDLLWKNKIQNYAVKRNNIHIARNNCFLEISKIRANTGKFYIHSTELSDEALVGLMQDEILGYSDTHNGYFITHDIYEEWGLERIINNTYQSCDVDEFFLKIGDGLSIRRAFRTWLSQKLSESNNDDIKNFVKEVFKSQSILQFWKDELIISVLLSEYCQEFFDFFETELTENDFLITKRILFLLQIACKEVSTIADLTKPKGNGWESVIRFIYKHKDDFFYKHYKSILPVLYDWVMTNHQGNTTKLAGRLAIDILNLSELENSVSLSNNSKSKIYKIIFLACNEIQSELESIFNMVIEKKFIEYNHPYYEFCSIIIEKSYQAGRLIQLLPKSIISLCELFWLEKNYQKSHYYSNDFYSEKLYGLHQHKSDYFPASAHQTPIWWLLNSKEFMSTISFIIKFTNETVENYIRNTQDKEKFDETSNITITICQQEITQFHNNTLWMMYRGTGSSTPYLLQSLHMALEKFLLEMVKVCSKITNNLLKLILLTSKSSSLTSVVCSIVLAYPDEFYDIAIILFGVKEFFHSDLIRNSAEHQAKSLYSIGYGLDNVRDILYTKERIETCNDLHRKNHLESLCLHYQFNGVKHYSEEENKNFINSIYNILDKHHSSFSNSEEDIGNSILFTRMDRRKLKHSIVENEKSVEIHLTPELSPPQKEQSQNAQEQSSHMFKYTELMLWADKEQDRKSTNKYDENPLLVFEELENLAKDWQNSQSYEFYFMASLPYTVCAKLIIKHSDVLSISQMEYCRDVILSFLEKMTLNDERHQIGDGFEECTHAIPKLIELFPEYKDRLIAFLLLILFKTNSLGAYKRICDYAIETIHEENLWEKDWAIANEILARYIFCKPLFNQEKLEVVNESRSYYNYDNFYEKVLNKFEELCSNDTDDKLDFNHIDFNQLEKHNIKDLEIVLQILPNDTNHSEHLLLLKTIMPKIAETLLNDKDRNNDIFYTRINTFEKLSEILLSRKDKNEICEILEPFLTSFKNNEYTADFFERMILTEDKLKSVDNFWHIWKISYTRIIYLFSQTNFYRTTDKVLINYLLAFQYWKKDAKHWHSLQKENLWLYEKISTDLPENPAVLYGISRVLYSIGSPFHLNGIDWLYNIIDKIPDLNLNDLESSTIFYLEIILRQVVFLNREKIKKDFRLKKKVIKILDFMIERYSASAYLFRENIL